MIILFLAALLAGIAGAVISAKKYRGTGSRKYLWLLIVCILISAAAMFLTVATAWLAWAVSVQPPD